LIPFNNQLEKIVDDLLSKENAELFKSYVERINSKLVDKSEMLTL